MTIIVEHNIETGEIIQREMNAQELQKWEAKKKTDEAEAQAAEEAAAAKAALLEKLGITEEEAKLLLS